MSVIMRLSSRGVARRLLTRQYPEVGVIAAEEFPPSHLVPVGPAARSVSAPTTRADTDGEFRP